MGLKDAPAVSLVLSLHSVLSAAAQPSRGDATDAVALITKTRLAREPGPPLK